VNENIHYPIRSQINKIQGRVFIQFIVGSDGKTCYPKIVSNKEKDLAFETIRLIRDSPPWIPGRNNHKEVAVQFTFPVGYMLDN
jgi:periplasmic protein TonB